MSHVSQLSSSRGGMTTQNKLKEKVAACTMKKDAIMMPLKYIDDFDSDEEQSN